MGKIRKFLKPNQSPSFRTDIAGIRGYAVLIVLLCHFEVPGFSGGFIGPDIFFVLSGYLITGLLVKEYASNAKRNRGRGTVSLLAFYLRRARRILPAALFVVLAINVWAFFNLNILQIAQIKSDSIWTVFFGANIAFLRQATDYFAQSNDVSPLQHYWSLSVEEQFYFVWPFLFLGVVGFRRTVFGDNAFWLRRLRVVFSVITIVSLAWLAVEFTGTPTASYFSTYSRAWELALGGLLSVLPIGTFFKRLESRASLIRFFSLAVLVMSLWIVTPTNFGYTLVIPAVATGILLYSGGEVNSDFVHKILSNRLLTGLGAISYSLYLWHWPVFVFGNKLGLMESLTQRTLGMVLCLVLSVISYYFVERVFLAIPISVRASNEKQFRPIRVPDSLSYLPAMTAALSAVVLVGVMTYPSFLSTVRASENVKASDVWTPPASALEYAPESSYVNVSMQDLLSYEVSRQNFVSRWNSDLTESVQMAAVPNDIEPDFASLVSESKNLWKTCDQGTYIENPSTQTVGCETLATSRKHTAVILGDSHARVLWTAFVNYFDLRSWHVVMLGQGNCPVADIAPEVNEVWNKKCSEHRTYTWNYIHKHKPDFVAISDSFTNSDSKNLAKYRDAYSRTISTLKPDVNSLLLISQAIPTADLLSCVKVGDSLSNCNYANFKGRDPRVVMQESVAKKFKINFLDMTPITCRVMPQNTVCPSLHGSVVTYSDGSHLTKRFSEIMSPWLAATMKQSQLPNVRVFSDELTSLISTSTDLTFSASDREQIATWSAIVKSDVSLKSVPPTLQETLSNLPQEANGDSWSSSMQCANDNNLPASDGPKKTVYCLSKPRASKTVMIIGDSFAEKTVPMVLKAFASESWRVGIIYRPGCMAADVVPSENGSVLDQGCPTHRVWMVDTINKLKPDVVIISENASNPFIVSAGTPTSTYRTALRRALGKLRSASKHIAVIGTYPGLGKALSICRDKKLAFTSTCYGSPEKKSELRKIQKEVVVASKGVYIDPIPWLCTTVTCPPVINNKFVYFDEGHLTEAFATELGILLRNELKKSGVL